jgi:hypothetical protein
MKWLIAAKLFPGLFDCPPAGIATCAKGDTVHFNSIYDIPVVIGNVIQIVMILTGALAVIFVSYAGVQYIVSQGDPQKTKDAKNTITYAIFGLVLSASAYLLVTFVLSRF